MTSVKEQSVDTWLHDRRRMLWPEVEKLPWAENLEWRFEDGMLRHNSGHFFSIIGINVSSPDKSLDQLALPMINQPEIGILGFIVFLSGDGPMWLLQAKSEPGSIDFVQAGPSVQATESNYKRVHGGKETRYLDFFLNDSNSLTIDLCQSEQGSKFINKKNRNAVRLVDRMFDCDSPSWHWSRATHVKNALRLNFSINTDARSVIACAPWELLCSGRKPFAVDDKERSPDPNYAAKLPDSFLEGLARSYAVRDKSVGHLIDRLNQKSKENLLSVQRVPLDQLKNWSIGENNIWCHDRSANCEIVSYRIFAPGREVEKWHQPLMKGLVESRAALVFQVRNGVLKSFVRFSIEPGFGTGVEFGPSYQSDGINPAWTYELFQQTDIMPVLSIRQSDEGGRFMHSVMQYSIYFIEDESVELPSDGGEWVNLAQLESLCQISGSLTNEARSLVSLLLSLA